MSEVLSVEQLTVRYGQRRALAGVSLALAPGRRVALLGANGAGKTTLLRAVAGRLARSAVSGRIEVAGQAAGTRAARASVGLIPQGLSLFPRLSARENLACFAQLGGLTRHRAQERSAAVLDWIGLADRGDEPVVRLSGGMQRRVSVGCGAVHEPALLLADEPTVGIDATHRVEVERLLETLRERGTTILESTHDLARVNERFDEVLVMAAGAIVASGPPATVIDAAGLRGHHCRVTLATPPGARFEHAGFTREGDALVGVLDDVARDLGPLLSALDERGLRVVDVSVEPPGLETLLRALDRRAAA